MSRKSRIRPYKTIDGGDLSNPTVEGSITTVKETDVVQVNFEWTGGTIGVTAGTIEILATMAENPNDPDAYWFNLDFGATIEIIDDAGDHQLVIEQVSFMHLKPKYTQTDVSAIGTLNATVFAMAKGS